MIVKTHLETSGAILAKRAGSDFENSSDIMSGSPVNSPAVKTLINHTLRKVPAKGK